VVKFHSTAAIPFASATAAAVQAKFDLVSTNRQKQANKSGGGGGMGDRLDYSIVGLYGPYG
jgi:hypothetical protein